jgi:RNA polymerase sigma-70 factor (ECF subfamily)
MDIAATSGEGIADNLADMYRAHHGWLRTWLRRQTGCGERAADLAQDTFLRLCERRENRVLGEPRAYLTTVARGLLIDFWRRQALERAWLEALSVQPEACAPSPEEKALALEALMQVDAMLDRLKPNVREAFLLAQLDGLTYREIGERLGVGERMVKKYMAEAMLHCLMLDSAAANG